MPRTARCTSPGLAASAWHFGTPVAQCAMLRRSSASAPFAYCSSEWQFEQYHASRLERLWMRHADEWQANVCRHIGKHRADTDQWLTYIDLQLQSSSSMSMVGVPEAFSSMVFRRGEERVVRHIEPLAASLRHPLSFCDANYSMVCTSKAWCQNPKVVRNWPTPPSISASLNPCKSPEGPGCLFERESWLLLAPPVETPRRDRGARAVLFDLGASDYARGPGGESTRWFVRNFQRIGIRFDDIFAYEAGRREAAQYWAEVPEAVRPTLHYFNLPASAEEGSPDNPLTLLAAVCRPCDYVVIKIDVDVAELEEAWIQQIRGSERLMQCIDVLFFEHHVGVPHTFAQNWWGSRRYSRAGNASTSFALFAELREKGILAHSWP